MNSTRILFFAFCLGLACLLLTGSAVAGTTAATDVTYAVETGAAGTIYTLPASTPTRLMNVLHGVGGDFFLDIALENGALWDASSPPVGGEVVCAPLATSVYTITLIGTPAGSATATYSVIITVSTPVTFPTCTFTATGLAVTDVDGVLAGIGSSISLNMSTRDAGTGVPIDVGGTASDPWLVGAAGVTQGASEVLVSTTAIIDVATARTEFIPNAGDPDTADTDEGGQLSYEPTTPGVLAPGGGVYALVATDFIDLVVTGDLGGISAITWAPGGTAVTTFVLAADVTAGSVTVSIPGDHAALVAVDQAVGIRIRVDGKHVPIIAVLQEQL